MPVVKPISLTPQGEFDPRHSMLALGMRKRLGAGSEYGFNDLGRSHYQAAVPMQGTYQRRVSGYNQYGKSTKKKPRTYFVQMRDCTPSNPRTVPQQANRNKFKDGMAAWSALTQPQKDEYNKKAVKQGRYGVHLFMKEYMHQ